MPDHFPTIAPATPLLDQIDSPSDLRQLHETALEQVAEEIRLWLLYCVGQTGGHFGAGLGVVELTLALHFLLNTPEDILIWDVGHQCYPHKIITGRKESLLTLRQPEGIAPFPSRTESRFDNFGTGHSSTSISAALGFALAHRLQDTTRRKSIAVIGDGAMTAGMAFEAMNHAGHTGADLLVILNDNTMSISPNEGGLASYLAKNLRSFPSGETTAELFEAMAFNYSGPVDGHDLPALLKALRQTLSLSGPQFLHILTCKGKGYAPAEADPIAFHAISKIEPSLNLTEVTPKDKTFALQALQPSRAKPRFSQIFGQWITEVSHQDTRICAITPAMREGSDLVSFSQSFPDRFFDVAIAEQHALTLAAGLAAAGMKPVVAIYSTFLQRAYDQCIHDVALQQLDVLLAIDRAGLVGEDGPTHAGCFDLAFLRCLPDLTLYTPASHAELKRMLQIAIKQPGLKAIRYPRGSEMTPYYPPTTVSSLYDAVTQPDQLNACWMRRGESLVILNFGPLLETALRVADVLNLSVIDMRRVKPLDEQCLRDACQRHQHLVTLEDHVYTGGAGSAVSEWLHTHQINCSLTLLGIPDSWVGYASREQQLSACGLDFEGVLARLSPLLALNSNA